MLVEHGYVRAELQDGSAFSFWPSFGRIAALGTPHEIVELFARLHGADPAPTAAYVLAGLCDQEDPTPLIGWHDEDGAHAGAMPLAEQVIIARHLMLHGIAGTARPDQPESGEFSEAFDAGSFIATARVHLGMSATDAANLTMTELQQLLEVKFPLKDSQHDRPSVEDYEAALAAEQERERAAAA